jgi:hypothetical protein
MAISEIAALALVVVVAIGAFLSWLTHRDIGILHRDFGTLTDEMRRDRVGFADAVASMRSAAASCDRAARACEANVALMREWFVGDRGPPGTPAE